MLSAVKAFASFKRLKKTALSRVKKAAMVKRNKKKTSNEKLSGEIIETKLKVIMKQNSSNMLMTELLKQ